MGKSNKELAVELAIAMLNNETVEIQPDKVNENGEKEVSIHSVLAIAYEAVKTLPDD